MKIDILIGENCYDTVPHFSHALGRALQKYSVSVRLLSVNEHNLCEVVANLIQDPPDISCSFSDITCLGKSLSAFLPFPHITFLIDPPIYSLHHFIEPSCHIGCVDQKDLAFLEALGVQHAFFFPHAIEASLYCDTKEPRPFETVFFGTCLDYEAIASKWQANEKELLLTAADLVLSDQECSVLEALVALGVKDVDLPHLHGELDAYTRGKDRVALIRACNTPVHIWGSGPWEIYCKEHIVHEPISFEKTFQMMCRSQVVLNSIPRFKQGSHERVFYASLAGAAVCSGDNAYLKKELPTHYAYQYGQWQLPSFKDWQERARQAQKKVLSFHTWDQRAKQLLNHLTTCL